MVSILTVSANNISITDAGRPRFSSQDRAVYGHAATLLETGEVFVCGGDTSINVTNASSMASVTKVNGNTVTWNDVSIMYQAMVNH